MNHERSLLWWAAYQNQLEIMKLLINAGMDIHNIQKNESFLDQAIHLEKLCMIDCFLHFDCLKLQNEEAKAELLSKALASKNLKIIERLIQEGLDINGKKSDGETHLSQAVKMTDSPGIKLILKFGGMIDIPNLEGETPINLALKSNPLLYDFFIDYQKNHLNNQLQKINTPPKQQRL